MTESEKFFLAMVKTGRISIDDNGMIFNHKTNRAIGAVSSRQYYKISMKCSKTGKIRHIQNHRLHWIIKVGEIPKGMEINHIDGNKLNNRIENLECVTPSENKRHAIRTGLKTPKSGNANHATKINADHVVILRKRYYSGLISAKTIQSKYRVSKPAVYAMLKGRTFASFGGPLEQISTKRKTLAECRVKDYEYCYTQFGISQRMWNKVNS